MPSVYTGAGLSKIIPMAGARWMRGAATRELLWWGSRSPAVEEPELIFELGRN